MTCELLCACTIYCKILLRALITINACTNSDNVTLVEHDKKVRKKMMKNCRCSNVRHNHTVCDADHMWVCTSTP